MKTFNKSLVHFIDMVYVNNYFWFSALEWNGFYRLSLKTYKAEFLGSFEKADVLADKLFSRILVYQNTIFFIPWFSDYLVSLETKTMEMQYWKLPESIIHEVAKFRAANIHEGKIYMFPHCGKDICIFDIEKEDFFCDNVWEKKYKEYATCNINDKFLQGCKRGDSVYLPSFSGSFIMNYKLCDQTYEIIKFPQSEVKIVDVFSFNENELLILSWLGNVWKYNVNTGQMKMLYQYDGKKEFPYMHIVSFNEYIYLIPSNEEKIKIITDENIYEKNYPASWLLEYINVGIESIFFGYYKDKDVIYLYPCKGNMMLKIELKTNCLEAITISETNILHRKSNWIEYMKVANTIVNEQKVGLDFFVCMVCNKKSAISQKEKASKKRKQIWINILEGLC